MNVAMMGLIKGFAEGTTERIKKEREEEEALIANRFKMAAINKKQREEEARTKKEEAKVRLDRIETLFPGASLEQKLALVSNESMFQIAEQQMLKEGDLDLDKFIVINKDKIPSTYKTAQDYVNSIVAQKGEMKIPEQQTKEVFFSSVSPSVGRQQAIASQYGTTAEDLYAYEGATTPLETPVFGSVNLESLKKNKTIDDRMTEASTGYADAVTTFGKDSPEAAAAKTVYTDLKTMKEELDPDEANWASYVGRLKLAILTAKTPEDRAAASKEYDRVVALEKRGKEGESEKIPSATALSNLFSKAAARAVTEEYGSKVKSEELVIETAPDGTSSFKYIGNDPNMQRQINQFARNSIKSLIGVYLDKEGRPLNRDVEAAIRSMGLTLDDSGRVVMPKASAAPVPPPGTETPKPTIPPNLRRGEPAAATTMSDEDKEAKQWAENNRADPRSATILDNLKKKYPGIN
jgi:hypothetical protein